MADTTTNPVVTADGKLELAMCDTSTVHESNAESIQIEERSDMWGVQGQYGQGVPFRVCQSQIVRAAERREAHSGMVRHGRGSNASSQPTFEGCIVSDGEVVRGNAVAGRRAFCFSAFSLFGKSLLVHLDVCFTTRCKCRGFGLFAEMTTSIDVTSDVFGGAMDPSQAHATMARPKPSEPGGYLQWGEPDMETLRIDKVAPEAKSEGLEQLFKLFEIQDARLKPTWAVELHNLFSAVGFDHVDVHSVACPPHWAYIFHEGGLMMHEIISRKNKSEKMQHELAPLLPQAVEETRNGAWLIEHTIRIELALWLEYLKRRNGKQGRATLSWLCE
ncbi:hypothetical protein MHUMG1_10168 [Metarhizium humberi]|uniref:Uncharacterized protein n=1 Tax=Metarhizium humberi TaxID=2596975 RepID=A0A9P8M3B5_9HYPO|nr:hypothetical protein MHUMG1_10168 [Metarhizium humberi]